uniref:Apple domain-containing protein n=1 Tax=Romanomermis culicivorax TaxID=13658 RepID=A0A915HLS5_ROMCU
MSGFWFFNAVISVADKAAVVWARGKSNVQIAIWIGRTRPDASFIVRSSRTVGHGTIIHSIRKVLGLKQSLMGVANFSKILRSLTRDVLKNTFGVDKRRNQYLFDLLGNSQISQVLQRLNNVGGIFNAPDVFAMPLIDPPVDYRKTDYGEYLYWKGFHFGDIIGYVGDIRSLDDCLKACVAHKVCVAVNFVQSVNLCVLTKTADIEGDHLWEDKRIESVHALESFCQRLMAPQNH